ncbi:TPR domain-containing protein [Colletotrichum truncatum]|uniref:TPR domain-containing protein n=1 Tax=Colletotrichum truncatum TaxID=5467 RepID=A0ACC3YUQ7_COLTU|nr:TPR domain-containing protein [Colletotrichum truncatum]KAF6785845.1 TPR domain-containing protein [Colletotrichum truncatum]
MAFLRTEKSGKISADEPYYDLGEHSRIVSTQNPDAQAWFNRGLVWTYSFNHREAAACFQQAILHDSQLAIAHWGVAFASGPNYNKVWQAFDQNDLQVSLQKCFDYSRKAKELSSNATPTERALIEALQHRFPTRDKVPSDFAPSVKAYADAMRQVYREFGQDDLDITTLFADSLMNTAPWGLYDAKTGDPILSTPVLETTEVLERGLTKPNAKRHPGLLHMYIHLVEMSKTPERAIKAADHLRDLVPEGGHMSHMPSHIDVLIGDYRRALHTNLKATIADDKYYALNGGCNFYSFYRMHNYHSLIYAAMMAGQAEAAFEAVSRMEATITEEMLLVQSPPMVDWLEFFKSVRVHVLIRFGRWQELKELPVPEDKDLYCTTVATIHYGKGIAYAATGDIENAVRQRELFQSAFKRVPETRMSFPNKVVDELKVAEAMLNGELEYRRGNYEAAFESLRLSIKLDDSLIYAEPWGWMVPTRHPYAALSLEQGHVEEAARVYAEDLGLDETLSRAHQHPNNIWALHGYHECLVRLGRTDEARLIKKQLIYAEASSDTVVTSSCFCRLDTVKNGSKSSGCCQ